MRTLGKKGIFDDVVDNVGALLILLLTFIILVLTVSADRQHDEFTYRTATGSLAENQQLIQFLRTETESGVSVADLFADQNDQKQQAFLKQIVTSHYASLHPSESWALVITYPDNTVVTIKSDDHRKKGEVGQLYLPTADGKAVKLTLMVDLHLDTIVSVYAQMFLFRMF